MSPSWEGGHRDPCRDPGGEGHRSGSLGNTDCGEGHRDFLILVSEDSSSYFEIFLVLSKTQTTISGLPPFSPPPWEAAFPAAPPQFMIGGVRGEEEEKEEKEENHTTSHSGSGTK